MTYDIRPGRPDEPNRERAIRDERIVRGAFPQGFGQGGFAQAGFVHAGFSGSGDASQWMLRRYLLARAIGASIVRTVHWIGVLVLASAVAVAYLGITWLAILIGLTGILILLLRVLLSAIQRRVSGIDAMGAAGPKVDKLVVRTRKGLRAELRRIGLPSAPWGPALIGLRLMRPLKRADTVRRLTDFDLTQVVPSTTLDELQTVLRNR